MIMTTPDSYSSAESIFDRCCEPLRPNVYRYIYYKVQNAEEAEELTQEVFGKVFAQLRKQAVGEESIRKYVYVAAKNIVRDLWRRKGRRPVIIPFNESLEDLDNQDDGFSEVEGNMRLLQMLNKLGSKEREVIVLRIIKGLPVSKVAEMLGKPEGTVKSLQFRALQKLRDYLDRGGYFD